MAVGEFTRDGHPLRLAARRKRGPQPRATPDLEMVERAPRQFAPSFDGPAGKRPQADPFSSAVGTGSKMCVRKMKPVLSSRSPRRSPRSHRPSRIVSPSGSTGLPRGPECSRSVQKRGHAGSRGTEQRHHSARADPGDRPSRAPRRASHPRQTARHRSGLARHPQRPALPARRSPTFSDSATTSVEGRGPCHMPRKDCL